MSRTPAGSRVARHRSLSFVLSAVGVVIAPLLVLASPASAANVQQTFDEVEVVANPDNFDIRTLESSIDGSQAGWSNAWIVTASNQDAPGVVIDYRFDSPQDAVTGIAVANNFGNITSDADGIGTATIQVLDSEDHVIFTGQFVGANGGAVQTLSFPGRLDDVATVRMSDITNLNSGPGAPYIGWREFWALQDVSTPSLSTVVNADGFSDDITVADAEGFGGTLAWNLYGPVPAGAGGACDDADWAGAPVYSSGDLAVSGDGTVTATPTQGRPHEVGCYSYAAVLSGDNYTADARHEVGDPLETFMIEPRPELTLTKTATVSDENGNGLNDAGDVVSYSFVVENTGNVEVSDIEVADAMIGGATCDPTTLGPGDQATCTGNQERTLTADDARTGKVVNTATASGTANGGTSVTSEEATAVVTLDEPSAGTGRGDASDDGSLPSAGGLPLTWLLASALSVLAGTALLLRRRSPVMSRKHVAD